LRLEHYLQELPQRPRRRLTWVVSIDNGEQGLYSVKPMEQHATKNGRWTKGRKFVAYRNEEFAGDGAAENASPDLDLSPQDRYVCMQLRRAEEQLRLHPEQRRRIWSNVFYALAGHPRIYLESQESKPLQCIAVAPRIHVDKLDGQYQYCLEPEGYENENLMVRLENGDMLCVYAYDADYYHLRSVMSSDFRVPQECTAENTGIMSALASRYTMISQCSLDLLGLPAEKCDDTPCLRLIPDTKGMRVQMLISPFGTGRDYCEPGEGPLEMVSREGEHIRRRVRDLEGEKQRAAELIAACESLTSGDVIGEWSWYLEGIACYEFSLQLRENIGKCRVQWPEDRKYICSRTITQSNVSLHTQSYQSWFSVDGEVHFDDTDASVGLTELMQAAVERRRFVALDDGQMVALSDGLRKRLLELARCGDFGKGKDGTVTLNVCRFLMPFVHQTLNGFSGESMNGECRAWIEKYDSAMEQDHNVPEGLQVQLRQYQHEGFTWLSRLDAVNAGACLADDMGLGKTVQAIALIMAHASEGPALVVAPTSVCANWLNEFRKYAPQIECEIFGPGDRMEAFRRMQAGHVLITSYGLLQSEQSAFRKKHWRVAVLDEAQAIKNSHAKRSQAALEIHADFRIVTTGTPVENNLN
ncbi:MAG: DEAD/DEAH box helicase family protein, partial [Victivallales bacterium]|nr:DEAD/DEAH box helicase family protein [Victivallales bacterium]